MPEDRKLTKGEMRSLRKAARSMRITIEPKPAKPAKRRAPLINAQDNYSDQTYAAGYAYACGYWD